MPRNIQTPGKDNIFRTLVGKMLVAARQQGRQTDLKIISSRLQEAISEGVTDVEALESFVMAGLNEVSRLPEGRR